MNVVYGYEVMTDRGAHLATLCPKCALAEAMTQRANRRVVVAYARNEYWYADKTKAESREARKRLNIDCTYAHLVQMVLWDGKARFDDDTSDGPGTYEPITTDRETETQMYCEHGHPILLNPDCVKLDPEKHGLDHCECWDCLGELHEDWSREPGDPIVVRTTFAYITYHLSIHILSTAADRNYCYLRRSALDLTGNWGHRVPDADALEFVNRLWWYSQRNPMGCYMEVQWKDNEKPYELTGTHFVGKWRKEVMPSLEALAATLGET